LDPSFEGSNPSAPAKLVVYALPLWLAYVDTCYTLATAVDVGTRTLKRAPWQWSKEQFAEIQ
jgi:hypothetical protein